MVNAFARFKPNRQLAIGNANVRSGALVIDNLSKAVRLQTSSSHEGAIDVRLGHQSGDILWFHRSAVKYSQVFCRLFRMSFREGASDKRVHILSLLRRRRTTSAYGPNRFVSNDDAVEIRGYKSAHSAT